MCFAPHSTSKDLSRGRSSAHRKLTSGKIPNQLEGDIQATLLCEARYERLLERQAGRRKIKPAGAEQGEQEQGLLILFARAPAGQKNVVGRGFFRWMGRDARRKRLFVLFSLLFGSAEGEREDVSVGDEEIERFERVRGE